MDCPFVTGLDFDSLDGRMSYKEANRIGKKTEKK